VPQMLHMVCGGGCGDPGAGPLEPVVPLLITPGQLPVVGSGVPGTLFPLASRQVTTAGEPVVPGKPDPSPCVPIFGATHWPLNTKFGDTHGGGVEQLLAHNGGLEQLIVHVTKFGVLAQLMLAQAWAVDKSPNGAWKAPQTTQIVVQLNTWLLFPVMVTGQMLWGTLGTTIFFGFAGGTAFFAGGTQTHTHTVPKRGFVQVGLKAAETHTTRRTQPGLGVALKPLGNIVFSFVLSPKTLSPGLR
jgi:hypothetical protein